MTVPRLGVVTIGQTPRNDLTPDLHAALPGVELVETGALDGLDEADLAGVAPGSGDTVLVSRLRSGRPIEIGEAAVLPLLTAAIGRAEAQGVTATLVACTDRFPALDHQRPLYYPDDLMAALLPVLLAGMARVAVLCPSPDQTAQVRGKAARYVSGNPIIVPYNPYTSTDDGVRALGRCLTKLEVDAVVGDCIGYRESMAEALRSVLGRPVLVARTVAASALAPLLGRGVDGRRGDRNR